MAKIEVEESDVAAAGRALALVNKLNANPKARRKLEAAIKEEFPEVETEEDVVARAAAPHIESIKALEAKLTETNKRLEDDIAARRLAGEERDTNAAFDMLRQAGYQDDGIEKIKAIMVDRKIADPEAAAALFDRQNPPARQEAASWEPQHWDITPKGMDEQSMKNLFTDEDRWADNQVGHVLTEMRRAAA